MRRFLKRIVVLFCVVLQIQPCFSVEASSRGTIEPVGEITVSVLYEELVGNGIAPKDIDGRLLGDIDGDGRVTPEEARLTLREAVSIPNEFTLAQKYLMDIDRDKVLSPADARLNLRMSVSLEKNIRIVVTAVPNTDVPDPATPTDASDPATPTDASDPATPTDASDPATPTDASNEQTICYEFNWSTISTEMYPTGFRTGQYRQNGEIASNSHQLRSVDRLMFPDGTVKINLTVPEGYCCRIAEYDQDGKWLRSIGKISSTPAKTRTQSAELFVTFGYSYGITIGFWAESLYNHDLESIPGNSFFENCRLVVTAKEEQKKNYVRYTEIVSDEPAAIESMHIFLPAQNGYIRYRLYHFVDPSINCSGWQLYKVDLCDNGLRFIKTISRKGEWECAVKLKEVIKTPDNDFCGGHTHGDEIENGDTVHLLIDGKRVDLSDLSTFTEFEELRFTQSSVLFHPADHVTPIADHDKEWLFSQNGLILSQSLLWLVDKELHDCYLGMALPSKTAVSFLTDDVSLMQTDLSAVTFPQVFYNASSITMNGQDTEIRLQMNIISTVHGKTGGDKMFVNDNNGLPYYKVYNKICGAGSNCESGELWQTTVQYQIDWGFD